MNLEGDALDLFRDVINYALEEQRNRGLEEAAQLVYRMAPRYRFSDAASLLCADIRSLKRDPKASWTKRRDEIARECAPWFEIAASPEPPAHD